MSVLAAVDPLEQVRELIVAAAEECFARYGLAKTTMEDVAKAASMSRATVYRHFADREALVTEVVVRHGRGAMEPARQHIGKWRKLSDKLVEGVLYNVRLGLKDPVMQHLMTSGFTDKFLSQTGVAVEVTYELWAPILAKAQERGQMRAEVDLRDAAAWLAQLTWMLVAQHRGTSGDRDEVARVLHQFLVPAFVAHPQ